MTKITSKKFYKKKLSEPIVVKAKKEKNKQPKKLPRIFRPIPEYFNTRNVFIVSISFLSGILLMAILFEEHDIEQQYRQLQSLNAQRQFVQQEVGQWQQVVNKYPDYRDGYFHLAVLEYQLGNKNAVQNYNEQALKLDPNFNSGIILAKKLQ